MSRYRLTPTPAQEAVMREHCAHARFVWNLGLEQWLAYRPGRAHTPGFAEQCRQLVEARHAEAWLGAGSSAVQQQALRDLDRAWVNFFAGTHRRPTWRKAGRDEGFRIVGTRGDHWDVRRLSRHVGEVRIAKVGWVRFRWSRAVPDEAKSFRVTLNRAGRWHVAFAVWPAPSVPAPGNGEIVGVDCGITVSVTLSTGEPLHCPGLGAAERARVVRLQRKLAKAKTGSGRRARAKLAVAKLHARESRRRKDWCEKVSTDLARRFDLIRVEDLKIANLVRSAAGTVQAPGRNVRLKANRNRSIMASGWGLMIERLEDKALGRVEKINPAYTSQRCSTCGHVAAESRKSQALFCCVACEFTLNADVNAAINIAAGHAVNARGGSQLEPVNREPQIAA